MMTSLLKLNCAIVLLILLGPCLTAGSNIFYFDFIGGNGKEQEAANLSVNIINTSNLTNTTFRLTSLNSSGEAEFCRRVTMLRQQNVVVLIEGSNCTTSACALSKVIGIPLIRLHGNKPLDKCEHAVHMSADHQAYTRASLEIMKRFQLENIVLIFDEHRFHEAVYFRFISGLPYSDVHFLDLSEYGNETTRDVVQRTLKQMEHLHFEAILVYSSEDYIQQLLTERLCPPEKVLLWILQGEIPFSVTAQPNYMVVAFRPEYDYRRSPFYDRMQALISAHELNSYTGNEALAFDAVQVLHQVFSEVVQNDTWNATDKYISRMLLNYTKKVKLDGLTGPIRFDEYGRRTDVQLEVLNLRNNSFVKIGAWNSSQHAVLFNSILRNTESSSDGGGLEGRSLRVVVIEDAPFVVKNTYDGTTSYEGYCIDLLNELARELKFTYEIYTVPDGKYGAETSEGEWNGLVGELRNKNADLVVAPITRTTEREKVIDFTVAYMYYTEEMIMKKPSSKEKVDYLQFMNPFANSVWFATLVSLFLISLAVFVLNYYSPYGYKDDNGRGTSQEFNFFNSVWFALACMLQQGGDNTPRSLSGRILAGCYWFCILIWVSTYTANLAAFFTVKNAANPIKNLEDVAKSTYDVGVLHSSSTYDSFRSSQYDVNRKIWQRMQAKGSFVNTTDQGIRWARERDDFIFINDGPILRYIVNKQPCDLTIGLNTEKGLAFALQPHDPHTRQFTLVMLHLREAAFLDQLRRKWWEGGNECPEETNTALSQQRIDLSSMLGVYLVLSAGIIAAFIALAAEIFWDRKAKHKIAKNIDNIRSRISLRGSAVQVVRHNVQLRELRKRDCADVNTLSLY